MLLFIAFVCGINVFVMEELHSEAHPLDLRRVPPERQQAIFGTGAELSQQIGRLWLTKFNVLEPFVVLGTYLQAVNPEANVNEQELRIKTFVAGVCSGAGAAWRLLAPIGVNHQTPVNLDFEIETGAGSEEKLDLQTAASYLHIATKRLLEQEPSLEVLLDIYSPVVQHFPASSDWFKEGAGLGFAYLRHAYQESLHEAGLPGQSQRRLEGAIRSEMQDFLNCDRPADKIALELAKLLGSEAQE
jgi:hypothetical protein